MMIVREVPTRKRETKIVDGKGLVEMVVEPSEDDAVRASFFLPGRDDTAVLSRARNQRRIDERDVGIGTTQEIISLTTISVMSPYPMSQFPR